MISKVIIGLLVAALGAASVAAFAHNYQRSPDHMVEKVTKRLDLDEQQQQALRELIESKQAMREQMREQFWDKKSVRQEMIDELTNKPTLQVSDITNLMDNKYQNVKTMTIPVLEKLVVFRNSLNPTQLEEARGFIQKMAFHSMRNKAGFGHHR